MEEKIKEVRFCEIHSAFHGEEIDRVGQLKSQTFTGEELKEFCEFYSKELIEGIIKEIEGRRDKTHPDIRYRMAIEILKSKI